MNEFIDFYKEVSPKLKKELIKYNNDILNEENKTIRENMRIFGELNESGKMVRGSLILLGYKLANKSDLKFALPLACAYEILETAILVHDDIIDKDDLRRGKQTIHAYNKEKYKDFDDNIHLSNSIALCVGDYGIYSTNQILVNKYSTNKNFKKLFTYYNETILNTIRGEIIDVITPYEEKNHILKDDLEYNIMETYKLKTSYYSIVGPLVMGMILGGLPSKKQEEIEKFALPLGIAFQIQDDYLGIYSKSDKIGKTVGSDVKEFKQTLLYYYTKGTKYYNELLQHYGKDKYDIKRVQEIFELSGSKEKVSVMMNKLYEESLYYLNKIAWLKQEDKNILMGLINYLKNREK